MASNVFLDFTTEGGGQALDDGTVPIFVSTVRSSALEPNRVVKTNGTKGLITGNVSMSDIQGFDDALEPLESRVEDVEDKTQGLSYDTGALTVASSSYGSYFQTSSPTNYKFGGYRILNGSTIVGGLARVNDDIRLFASSGTNNYALRTPVGLTRQAFLYDPRSEKGIAEIKEDDQLTTKEYVDSEIQPLDSRVETVETNTLGLSTATTSSNNYLSYSSDATSFLQTNSTTNFGGFRILTNSTYVGGLLRINDDIRLFASTGASNFALSIPIGERKAILHDPRSEVELGDIKEDDQLTTKEYVDSEIQPLESRVTTIEGVTEDFEKLGATLSYSPANAKGHFAVNGGNKSRVYLRTDGIIRGGMMATTNDFSIYGGSTSTNYLLKSNFNSRQAVLYDPRSEKEVGDIINNDQLTTKEYVDDALQPLDSRVESVEVKTNGLTNTNGFFTHTGDSASVIQAKSSSSSNFGGFRLLKGTAFSGGLLRMSNDLMLYATVDSTNYALRMPIGLTREVFLHDPRSEKGITEIKEDDQLTTKEYVDTAISEIPSTDLGPLEGRVTAIEGDYYDKSEINGKVGGMTYTQSSANHNTNLVYAGASTNNLNLQAHSSFFNISNNNGWTTTRIGTQAQGGYGEFRVLHGGNDNVGIGYGYATDGVMRTIGGSRSLEIHDPHSEQKATDITQDSQLTTKEYVDTRERIRRRCGTFALDPLQRVVIFEDFRNEDTEATPTNGWFELSVVSDAGVKNNPQLYFKNVSDRGDTVHFLCSSSFYKRVGAPNNSVYTDCKAEVAITSTSNYYKLADLTVGNITWSENHSLLTIDDGDNAVFLQWDLTLCELDYSNLRTYEIKIQRMTFAERSSRYSYTITRTDM